MERRPGLGVQPYCARNSFGKRCSTVWLLDAWPLALLDFSLAVTM